MDKNLVIFCTVPVACSTGVDTFSDVVVSLSPHSVDGGNEFTPRWHFQQYISSRNSQAEFIVLLKLNYFQGFGSTSILTISEISESTMPYDISIRKVALAGVCALYSS